ncbi:MAG TPA: DUF2335 domain-containing protein [Acidobacteriaceae bacterium]|jgi:uncharacterized membrane protein|nr:DUF2335 domain-containing protein [Acidobacteriaceae bacterium]
MADQPPDPTGAALIDPSEIDEQTKRALQLAIRESLDAELRRAGITVPPQKEQVLAERVTSVAVRVAASFQGPMPPPAMMRAYDEVVPGLAKQIAESARLEQEHRHRWERRALWNDIFCQSGGLLLGWMVTVGCAVAAFILAWRGNNWGAGVMFSATVGMIIRTIVHNGGGKQASLEQEKPANRPPPKPGRQKRR